MKTLMRFSYEHPWLVVAALFLISLFSALQIPRIEQDPSSKGMTLGHDPSSDVYEDTLKTFGSDKITVIYVQDKDLFTPGSLARLEDLVYALEDLPGVVRVDSLFSATQFRSENGMLYPTPLVEWLPETAEEARLVKRHALSNPLLVDILVSREGNATAVNLFLEPNPSNPRFNQEFNGRIMQILQAFQGDFERVYSLGNPYFWDAVSRLMLKDQKLLVPLSVFVLLLALMGITRSRSGAVLPLLTSGISILWTLAFMGVIGIPMNMLTIIIPSLILVIGATEDIHLLSEYLEGLHQRNERHQAIHYMIGKAGTVITVTALTTFFGFLCISINQIPILRQFGMAAAFGLLVNPVITALVAPVYFRITGPRTQSSTTPVTHRAEFIDRMAVMVTGWFHSRRKTVLALSIGVAAAVALFSPRVRLNNDILGVFKENSEISQRIHELSRHLAGVQTFSIRIDAGHEGLFKDPEHLTEVAAIQDFMREQGRFDKSLSLVDILRTIQSGMEEGVKTPNGLPDTQERVSQYLLFVQPQDLERYVSPNFSKVNIVVRHNLSSSHEQTEALEELKAFIENTLNPHFTYALTGESILTLRAADAIAEGQAKSVLLLISIIFVIMSLLFINVKAGLLSLVPNILPVAFAFGLMGLLGIPLNIGTAMVAAIAIGIAVDDTIHFMTRYNTEMKRLKDQDLALRECIKAEMLPAFSSSAALALGFVVLGFSGFVPIVHFGLLSATVMVVAFLSDMLVTPALLSRTRFLTLWDMIGLHLRKEVVERSEFFRDLKPWQIKKIILLGHIRDAQAGEILFKEWDAGDSMYLLLQGEVQVYGLQEETGREIAYNLLLPGDIFGQIAMLEPGPRSAHVRAKSDATFVEINREDFDRLQAMYPRIAAKALRNMARILGHQLVISSWRYKEKAGN
jgi:predicted RND superfamily exporter protein